MRTQPTPAEFAEIFTDVGRQLADKSDRDSAMQALSDVAVARVPAAQYAGVTVARATRMTTVGATDELVYRTDTIQYDLRSGPCVDEIIQDTRFVVADPRIDERWPEFGPRAAKATGIVSMLSIRLFFQTTAVWSPG